MRLQFILVALLCLYGLSRSQECRPRLMVDVKIQGEELTSLFSPDAEHCQQLCTQHPSCQSFVFVRPDSTHDNRHFFCKLKSLPGRKSPRQGVTSGFSLKHCHTESESCLSQVYHDVDFPGADYQTLFTADYEECQRACGHDPTCQFFSFIDGNSTSAERRYKCHLKFSWTVPRIIKLAPQANLVSGFSHNVQVTPSADAACQTKLFPNTDIPGNSMEDLPAASSEHCHVLCTAHPQCTYFSYSSDDFMCRLKKNPNEMVIKAKAGVTSGIPARACHLDNAWLMMTHDGVDFWGSDYHDLLASDTEACQRACTQDRNCQYYTYVTDGYSLSSLRRICYLKRSISLPAPPQITKLAGAVSGFSQKNCGSSAHAPIEEEV